MIQAPDFSPPSLNRGAHQIPYFTSKHIENQGALSTVTATTPTIFTLRRRIVLSPMCKFLTASFGSKARQLTEHHVTTIGHYALKRAALVFIEVTDVTPNGRITPNRPGLWDDTPIPGVKKVADSIKSQGALCGIQLGHAGRKASQAATWLANRPGVPIIGADEGVVIIEAEQARDIVQAQVDITFVRCQSLSSGR